MEKGYDVKFLPVGTTAKGPLFCPVCEEQYDVDEDYYGPCSWAGAMGKVKTHKEKFTCPNAEEKWHLQAKELLKLEEKTPSAWLAAEFKDEREKIVKDKKCTKNNFYHL